MLSNFRSHKDNHTAVNRTQHYVKQMTIKMEKKSSMIGNVGIIVTHKDTNFLKDIHTEQHDDLVKPVTRTHTG